MPDDTAQYACDKCRSRKVSCSREQTGCQRCKAEGLACSYSRSGIIRRSKKQNFRHLKPASGHGTQRSEGGDVEPQLAADINKALERLQCMTGKHHASLRPLAALMGDYVVALQDTSPLDHFSENPAPKYFLFADKANEWTQSEPVPEIYREHRVDHSHSVFSDTLDQERLLLHVAPPEVLTYLRLSQPDRIQDRAWLLMFYSIMLHKFSATNPEDYGTKSKLKSNLRLALGDVRVLLEPTASHCQALIIMALYLEDFSVPALCWMLISKACIMLQAIGIIDRRLDEDTSERRKLVFWRLNVIDKTLALILRRPPTFHRAMSHEIEIPSLECLFRSLPPTSTPALFDAHFIHQMYQLAKVVGDIWHCVFYQYSDPDAVPPLRQELQSWYHQAKEILHATAVAERPFHSAEKSKSLDFSIIAIDIQYYYLDILLTRTCAPLRSQGTLPSQYMLNILDKLEPGTQQQRVIPSWQILHAPFTIFLTLFGEIVSTAKTNLEQNEQSLEAMTRLPVFLIKLIPQYPFAARLQSYASEVLQHTKSILYDPDETEQSESSTNRDNATHNNFPGPSNSSTELLTPAPTAETTSAPGLENMDAHLGFPLSWTDDSLFDASFDLFTWWDQQNM